ncbi:galectin-related protein A isoform X1 [Hemitrygon akajei]|uniref:galectin-related protein A isoform X1 n=1 Tax=Hemitrygon akajei TaxID=2704970 RepID=UPI003BF98BEF
MADNDSSTPVKPFVGEIKSGLKPSMRMTIMGIVHSKPNSFVISLISNPLETETDIGLEVTVSFRDRSVVRNAKVSGKWGKEEKNIPYFPFTAMQHFKMEILCEHQQFRVQVDGQQLFDFTYRFQQIHKLTALKIIGDLRLTKVV